jgi:hypothetical protein
MYNNNLRSFEFDLNKYSIDELYNLFQLQPNTVITEEVLRHAKRILIKVHPDKSTLPKEYFIFFSKAYKLLEQMSLFNKQSSKERSTEYVHDDIYEQEVHDTISQNKDDNNKFNNIFEKINSDMLPSNKSGYGEWLSKDTSNISINNHNIIFEKYKKKYNITDVSIYNVNPITSNFGDSLIDDNTEYTSDIFSSLKYNDLKKSYNEPLFTISDENHSKLQKYENLDQLMQSRKSQSLNPLTQEESLNIINNNLSLEQDISTQRAYKLAKELERSQLKNIQFTSNFFKILN